MHNVRYPKLHMYVCSYLPLAVISSTFTVTETEQQSIGPSSSTTGCASPLLSPTSNVKATNPTEISEEKITIAMNAQNYNLSIEI